MHIRKTKRKQTANKPNKYEYTVLSQKANSNIELLLAELEFHCKGRLQWDQLGLQVKQPPSQSNRCNEVIFSGVIQNDTKHVLPALQKSNKIYQFSCHCDSRYVGSTSERLQDRLKQQVHKSICSCSSSRKCLLPDRQGKSSIQTYIQSLVSDSAIGLQLQQNPICAQHYDDSSFSILA